MKKITILIPNDETVEFPPELLTKMIEFHMETIPDYPDAVVRVKKPKHRIHGRTTRQVIMSHYAPAVSFKREVARKWLANEGFSPASASPAISSLRRDGFLKEIDHQLYQFQKAPDDEFYGLQKTTNGN